MMEIVSNDAGERMALINNEWVPYVENKNGEALTYNDGAWNPVDTQQAKIDTTQAKIDTTQAKIDTTQDNSINTALGTVSSIAQGATAGWIDEVLAAPMAGAAHLLGDATKGDSVADTYSKMKEQLRLRDKQFSEESPALDFAGNLVGGIVGLGKIGAAGSALKAGAAGAGYGAAEYAGDLDSLDEFNAADAAKQTAIAGAIPLGINAAGRGISKYMAGKSVDEGNTLIKNMVSDTGMSPSKIKAKAKEMGPESSLADVTGAPGAGYLQGSLAKGDMSAADVATKNLDKVHSAKNRIKETMSGLSGKEDGNYFSSLDTLKKTRKDKAEKLYGKALNEGSVVPTKRMVHILENNPTVKDAWIDVKNTYEKNGIQLDELFPSGQKVPNMRAVQELKWGMDKRLADLKGSIDSAGKKEYSRALVDYKDFMTDVNKSNPAFKKANSEYAGDSAIIDAQRAGFKNGLGSANVEAEREAIKSMGRSEKDAYLQGVLAKAYGKMGTSSETVMGNVNQLSSENSFKILKDLIGKNKAGKLMKRIRTEKRYREVENKALQGSQTQMRQHAGELIDSKMKTIPVSDVMSAGGNPGGLIKSAADYLFKFNPKMSQKQLTQFVDDITKSGGVDEALNKMNKKGIEIPDKEGFITNVLQKAAPVAVSQY